MAKVDGKYYVYTAGNAGNGANPQPDGVVLGAGTQIITPSSLPESAQNAGRAHPGRLASASPSWATRRTRSARTTTSAA